ncbi:class I SAM-dependent methyltransferase [Kitasatospora indigofera]|uniref:class I SAM-dependent methyltransferase n=1 Tax=Kitasatospora indigofera TaxID=67307 RepID=UPI0036C1E8B0
MPGAVFEVADVRTWRPAEAFDAVCAFFPLLVMPRQDVEHALERIASWVAPGGLLVFATVPGDLDEQPMEWMGRRIAVSSLPTPDVLGRLDAAGLQVTHHHTAPFRPDSPLAAPEEHLFVHARRPDPAATAAPEHALLGPWPHPARYRGPHTLSTSAWAAFEPHFRRSDIAAVVDALTGCTRILDVGGGNGAGARAIAGQHGACTTVEPDPDGEARIRHPPEQGITVHPARAGRLPFPDQARAGRSAATGGSAGITRSNDGRSAARERPHTIHRLAGVVDSAPRQARPARLDGRKRPAGRHGRRRGRGLHSAVAPRTPDLTSSGCGLALLGHFPDGHGMVRRDDPPGTDMVLVLDITA